MPTDPAWIAEGAASATSVPVDVVKRASTDLTTTTTADPGSGGTTLAVTANSRFPAVNGYQVRVENEIMLVTAGAGTNSWTVTRGQEGTTAVAHTTGVTVALVTAVQRVEPIAASRQTTYLGRAATFRIPGRAGTAGQKLMAIHNSTTSSVLVNVKKITVDATATVVKAVTVLPPVIRLWRFTAVPTNGSALGKVPEDSSLTSSASVTLWQDASGDGASSATALTVTLPSANIMAQSFAPRLITAAGYEMFDREVFLENVDDAITLRPLQGVCVFLDYTLATQNPTTDMWIVGLEWEEFTAA
jgi:hypothetical protein